jgi:predicted component of type VI protein secretion system
MPITVPLNQQNTTFTDLDDTFAMNPMTGDLAMKTDGNAIKQSIRNLVSMRPLESPFHPEISSPVYGLLFELPTPLTVQLLQKTILQVIQKFEPRVTNVSVIVQDLSQNNAYQITINFTIIGTGQTATLNTLLKRLR